MAPRSPNYPAIDLATALVSVEKAFKAENRNKMSRLVLAKNLGYNSLNGRSLGQIGAVRAYGLIDGRGDELRVSDDAVTALMAPGGSPERKGALERLAEEPGLFKQLRALFPDAMPSEENIKFQLVKRGFTADAAGKAAKTYLKTMKLVSENPNEYYPSDDQEEPEMQQQTSETKKVSKTYPEIHSSAAQLGGKGTVTANSSVVRRAVFTLDEGDVVIEFPKDLSKESVEDLAEYLETFMKRARRETKDANTDEAAN